MIPPILTNPLVQDRGRTPYHTLSMPFMRSSKLQINEDDLLANASTALSIANNFASLIHVPIVSSLIQTAQNIVTAAQVNRCRVWMESGSDLDYAALVRLSRVTRELVLSLRTKLPS